MHIWGKRIFMAAAPLLLTGCLWGPGKFASDLTLKRDGSFVLDYRGEIVLQTPPDAEAKAEPWSTEKARCRKSGKVEVQAWLPPVDDDDKDEVRPCTPTELAKAKADFEKQAAERAKSKREDTEQMAKLFGMPGFDDESSRAFAASSDMSMSMSPSPPVRSTFSGACAAATFDSMLHSSSSIAAICSVE